MTKSTKRHFNHDDGHTEDDWELGLSDDITVGNERRPTRTYDTVTDVYPEDQPLRRGTGGGRGHGGSDEPTEKQQGFLRKLVTEAGGSYAEVESSLRDKGLWTRKGASEAIDAMLALAKVRKATEQADNRRPNRYAGRCVRCGGWVEAEAGYLAKDANGKWAADHKGDCPAKVERAAKVEPPEGIHRLGEDILKVQVAVHGSGNLYAKRLVIEGDHGSWVYEGRSAAFHKLSADTLMSLEDAKEFGALYGFCCNCGKTLTDETSIEAGIGPVCAKRFAS